MSASPLASPILSSIPASISSPIPAPGTATYRAFYLDASRRVRSARILRASTDVDARVIARTLPNEFGIELWERDRFLASFPPRAGLGVRLS